MVNVKKKVWPKVVVLCSIIVAVLVLDLVTKYVFDAILGSETIAVIPYLFNFKMVRNYGAAWGVLAGKQVFLIVLNFIYLAIFAYFFFSILFTKKEEKKHFLWLLTVACAFIFAGGIGNLYDRIGFGYVRDFIQFDFWQEFPVFNFADVSLCVGVVVFIVYLILVLIKERKKTAIKIETPEESDAENFDENAKNGQKFDKKSQKNAKKREKIVKNEEIKDKKEND